MSETAPPVTRRGPSPPIRRGVDWTAPFSSLMALLLAGLVLLPLYWLLVTSLRDPAPTVVTAYTVQLDPVTRRGADLTVQPVRPGASIRAVLTNSNPAAGSLKAMDMTISAGSSSAVTHFAPAAVGSTIIAVTTPPGYAKAANSTALTVTVRE